jgi:hypothetical protein
MKTLTRIAAIVLESHPFPDVYVFVPALRRSLRRWVASRCSPVFGFDWTNDDAKFNGFNGSTAIYTADYLGDRRIPEPDSVGRYPGK